jgi:hypothetical protein
VCVVFDTNIYVSALAIPGGNAEDAYLARIIHERFCCNRRYAATTGRLVAQSFNVLFKYDSLPRGSACLFRGASPRFRDDPS